MYPCSVLYSQWFKYVSSTFLLKKIKQYSVLNQWIPLPDFNLKCICDIKKRLQHLALHKITLTMILIAMY